MTVLVLSVLKARSIVSMLVIALFFSIAMDPAVTSLHVIRGWKRGPATVVVFAVVLASVILLPFELAWRLAVDRGLSAVQRSAAGQALYARYFGPPSEQSQLLMKLFQRPE